MMDAIELLQQLVAIPSLSGNESGAVKFLVSAMNELGFSADIDQVGNAVGIREHLNAEGQITCEIMLLGHIDTVPGEIPVRIEDGKLFGRGTVDAKGPLSAFVKAASQATLPPGTRIVVVGAVEEESATSKGARHIAQNFSPDFCIIGEPSGLDSVTLGYKGRLLIDYTREQSMAHSAGNQLGVAEEAVEWWNQLSLMVDHFNQDQDKLFDQILPSLRHIKTGSDGLINRIDMKVGLRLPPNFDAKSFQQKVCKLANGAKLKMYAFEPAYQSSRLNPLARVFNKVLRQSEVRTRFKLKTGTSDMNVVGPVWQVPIVAYGPGDSALDHTPDEHVFLHEYLQAIGILESVLQTLGQELVDKKGDGL